MSNQIRKKAKLVTYLCALIYFTSYVMRLNFAVMLVKICSDLGIEKSTIAVVITCMTLSYGFGQIISGLLGDKFKAEHLITVGLITAIFANIAMFFANSVPCMAIVWTVNGFAQALLWPPIVKLFSKYLRDEEYSYGVVRVSWGSSYATIFLYLLCPLCLSFMSWRQIILACAFFGIIVLLVWIFTYKKVLNEPLMTVQSEIQNEISENAEKSNIKLPKSIYLPIGLIMLGIVLQGTLRDGVTNWMPSFLLESFNIPEEKAIISTVILAIFSVISFGLFDFIYRKFFKNEVQCGAFIFAIAAFSSVLMYFANKFFSNVFLSMLLMAIIVACMHGINLMLIAIVPKAFVKVGKVSTFSGILNSCTYIGAAISTYGFAVLAENFGWGFTILTWVGISVLGIIACKAAVLCGWKKKYKDYLS